VFGDITVGMRACIRAYVYTINYIVQTFGKINDSVNVYGAMTKYSTKILKRRSTGSVHTSAKARLIQCRDTHPDPVPDPYAVP